MLPRLDILLKEASVGVRALRRDAAYTLVSVLLLTVGIGFTSAVFNLLWQVVYAQLPVSDPEHLFTFSTNVVHKGRSESDVVAAFTASAPMYSYIAANFHASSGVLARAGALANIQTPHGPRHLQAELVSGNFFAVLGLQPLIGRAITPENDVASDASYVTVLSYAFWQDAFGGQISALNSIVRVNGVPFRVIGGAQREFNGLIGAQSPQIYIPLAARSAITPGWNSSSDWGVRWLNIFFRLPAAMPLKTAEAELDAVYHSAVRLEVAAGPTPSPSYLRELTNERVSIAPASQGLSGTLAQWRQPLRTLQWLTAAVLLLTCVNIAGLAVVRTVRQRQEIIVRYALGASRGALVRWCFIQTFILAGGGGLAALWFARLCARLLIHLGQLDNNAGSISVGLLDYGLVMHWAAALGAGLVIGLFPAWHASRVDLAAGMRESDIAGLAGRSHSGTRRILATAQIGLSLALLITAGLFAKSLHNLTSVPVGFDPEHLTLFSVDSRVAGSSAQTAQLMSSSLQRALLETPGVQAAGYGTGGPFPQASDAAVLLPDGQAERHQSGMHSNIGPGYFGALHIPVLSGREFDARDMAGSPASVIVNETMARKLFTNQNPIGRQVTLFNGIDPNVIATVIGVVADHRVSWSRTGVSLLYTPLSQAARPDSITFYVRTATGFLTEDRVREIVRRQASTLAAFDVQTMPARMAAFISRDHAMSLLIGLFALLAFVIALSGIYGVVAYSSALRTTEFGVRFALGAARRNVIWLVLREAALVITLGVLFALPLLSFTLFSVRPQLHRVTLFDITIWAPSVLALVSFSFLAAVIPAARVARMNIQNALRSY